MAVSCAGLGDSQAELSCESRLASASTGPGATRPELQINLGWLLLVLGLEVPRQSQAVNLGWLLLIQGLGFTEASCCLFERI